MEDATALGLPWRMLREKLVTLDSETSKVNYESTFQVQDIPNVSQIFSHSFSTRI